MNFKDQHYTDTAGAVHFLSAADHASAIEHRLLLPHPDWTPCATPVVVTTALEQAQIAIAAIEATITPRRMREALLTTEGKNWLKTQEAEIAKLRP